MKNITPLIKRCKEHLLKENFDNEEIPETHGIYCLYREDELVYVGRTKNIKKRIFQRLHSRSKIWNRFSWYETTSDRHYKELEAILINISRPKYNKASGWFQDVGKKIVIVIICLIISQAISAQNITKYNHTLTVNKASIKENVQTGGVTTSHNCKFTVTDEKGNGIPVSLTVIEDQSRIYNVIILLGNNISLSIGLSNGTIELDGNIIICGGVDAYGRTIALRIKKGSNFQDIDFLLERCIVEYDNGNMGSTTTFDFQYITNKK